MAAQEWLLRRLGSLSPSNFGDGVCFVACSPDLEAPAAFAGVWFNFVREEDGSFNLMSQALASCSVLVIVSSPFAPGQLRATSQLVAFANTLGSAALFWVPHTVAPEVRPRDHYLQAFNPEEEDGEIRSIMEMGVDGVLADEPAGMRLALQVRKETLKYDHLSKTVESASAFRHARTEHLEHLRSYIHIILWDYLRMRMARCIPPCKHSSLPREVRLRLLGRGTTGGTFGMTRPGRPRGAEYDEVVKVVEKANITNLKDLERLKGLTEVMRTVSSDWWRHPNIMKLVDIQHSTAHILFRQEYCGHVSLHARLKLRHNEGVPFPAWKVSSAIQQAFTAVAHLHTGPGICHRDLKPESFLLKETAGGLLLTLTEFDFAIVLGKGSVCRQVCGTMPFAAPEVLTSCEYDGRAADMWSLGVTLLEVLCGLRVLEKAFHLQPPEMRMARRIANKFSSPETLDSLLMERTREDLSPILPVCRSVACGTLTVNVPKRWTAKRALPAVMSIACPETKD